MVAGAGALLEPAVPTLQLDPALRAAALAAPPPAADTPADSAHASPTPHHAHERRRRTHLAGQCPSRRRHRPLRYRQRALGPASDEVFSAYATPERVMIKIMMILD